jgi:TonB family protein
MLARLILSVFCLISGSLHALEPIADDSLSGTTGAGGVTIESKVEVCQRTLSLGPDITLSVPPDFQGGRYVTLDKEGEGVVEFTLTADGQVTNPVTYKSIGDDNTDQLLLTLVKGMNVKYIGAEAGRAKKYTVFVHISFKDDCQQY